LLKDALGGNCKTVLIATISPALAAVEETISTLTYAEQANGIQNKPVATSFLKMKPNAEGRGDFSGSSLSGCSMDWAEIEMKMMYLTQEVEEAQAALARKYQEMQDLTERAEIAEQESDIAKAQVSEMQEVLTASAAAHTRSATSACDFVVQLRTAIAVSAAAREEESRKLSELRGQRFIEEQVIALLQTQRQELHDDVVGVQEQLEGAKTEVLKTKAELTELKAAQATKCEDALQAMMKAVADFKSVQQGFTDGVDASDTRLSGVCQLLDSTSEAASAAAARSAGTSEKGAEAISSWCQEYTSKVNALQQHSGRARQALETSTIVVADQLSLSEKASIAAAQAATPAAPCTEESMEPTTLKENQGVAAGKAANEKKVAADGAGQAHQRTVFGVVN
jgi:chromosome segregation ATPase